MKTSPRASLTMMVTWRPSAPQVPQMADAGHAEAVLVEAAAPETLDMVAAAQLDLQLLDDVFLCNPPVDVRRHQNERRRREDHPMPRLAELGDRGECLIVYALGPCSADHVGHRIAALPHTPHIPSHSLMNRFSCPRSSAVDRSTLSSGIRFSCMNCWDLMPGW